jgi:D-tagatose-1,6-bisphosphate aldolase subunit GatZ/KbaZ
MEEEYLPRQDGPQVREALEQAMLADPTYWQKYYHGTPEQAAFARKFSFSDRSRYYWPRPEVEKALERLIGRLKESPPPLSLVSQYMPIQYQHIREGHLRNTPTDLIYDRIKEVVAVYAYACGY